MGKATLHARKCVWKMLITCFVFACQMPCAGTTQCLSDAVPESERQYIQNDQGKDIPVGLFECTWVTSAVMTKMAQIWIEEVLGYHTEIPPQKGTSGASAIWALAGCTSFDDANDKGCGQNETKFHVSMDTWVGSYAAQQEAFLKEYPQIAAIDVGSMGYGGEESIYVSKAIIDKAQQDVGLALTYYQSYNTTHHDPQKYFDSLSDVDPSELALCSDTDFSSSARMNAYARYSGDYDGMVQQPDGSYFAKCVGPGERWWAAPACRSDLTKCIPTFTASPGWKLQAMMQWTSAYGFPAAIAISNIWANFEKHVRTFRALHYWWVPDSTFIEMQPQPIIFPRHSASEWAAGDKKTGGVGSYISKMVSSNLHSKASLVQDFIGKVQFELLEVQNLLLLHKQSGATTYFDAACNWIKLHRSRWTRWIPDKTQCSAQFGLFNEKTNQFVQSRADQTDLICRACPSGHFSQELQDGLGSGTTHRCVACPVGTSQASGASLACNPCSKGEYQDEEAKSSCKRCEKGRYQGQEGQSQCLQCPPGTTTLGFGSNDLSDCGCNELTINAAPNETTFKCVPCSDGLHCPFSSTIQSLKDGPALANDQTKDFVPVVKEGYYASQENPTSVYLCKPSYFCLRGRPGECGGGLQGVPCAICPDGQTWSEDQCVDCGLAGSPVAWLFGILIGLAGLVALYYMSNTKATEQASPIKVLTMAMGLTVNVMQTVSLMGMMTVTWPREMDAASSGLQFMILDVQSLGLQCFFGSGAVARYNWVAAVFPIMLLWLLTCSLASGFFPKRARHFQPWTWPGTFNVMGLLLQVAFSTVSAVALQPLMCYSHPNGMRSLLKYPNVMCGESAQSSMLVVGLIMGSVFVVAFYVGCIYAAYHMPSWGAKQMTAALLSFRFLSSNFRLNRWWFGLLLLARGFGFCLVIVVATDTVSAQTSLATLILVLYGFSQAIVWPWKAPIINVFDVVLSALLLLLVNKTKTTSQTESANDDWDFSRIFTLLLLLLIAAALATLILVSLAALLAFYLSPHKNRKNRSTTFTNLSKPTSTEAVIRALQQVAEAFSRSERQEIEENLAAMNHYDFKAVVNAIHIISHSVLPMGELPAEMKPSLRVMHSHVSLKSKQSMELGQDPGLQPEPEEVASMAATVTGSDPPQVEIDPRNEAGSGAGEAAAGSWNLTGLENVGICITAPGKMMAEQL